MRNLNKPNRYNVASIQAQQTLGGDVMQSDEEGQYVTWRDYAWLLAEVERLRASSFVTAVPVEEYEKLKAEVERLRKAGDAVNRCLEAYLYSLPYDGPMTIQCIQAWNAAKEGKPQS